MSHVLTIASRELRALFVSPVAYVVLTLWSVIAGTFFLASLIGFHERMIQLQQYQMLEEIQRMNLNDHLIEPFVGSMWVILLFLLPAITMGLVANEKANGTEELLLTSPISIWDIVLGKFTAGVGFVAVMTAIVAFFPALLFVYGEPEVGKTLSGIACLLLVSVTYVAVGVFASSVTRSQLIAFILTLVLLVMLGMMLPFVVEISMAGSGPRPRLGDRGGRALDVDRQPRRPDAPGARRHGGSFLFRDLERGLPAALEDRDRIGEVARMSGTAALLAGLGVVAVGFGLLSALMALIQPYTDPYWIFGNLVVGVALLGAAVVMSLDSLRERLQSGGGRRAGRYGTSAIVGTALGIVILGLLGFLSTRYHTRFDVSEAGVHTLSPQTTGLLAGLTQTVTITGFFDELDSPEVAALLERYDFESDRVEVRFVDPNEDPMLVEELALDAEQLARGLIHIALDSGEQTTVSEFTGAHFEPDITNALVKLVQSTGKKVYFLTGHNERRIEAAPGATGPWASGPDTFGRAAAALENETYGVAPLLLVNLPDVPEDAAAVVIAGPTQPLLAGEIEALRRYVDGGGSLLVALDPRAQTNLYDLLGEWGRPARRRRGRRSCAGGLRSGHDADRPGVRREPSDHGAAARALALPHGAIGRGRRGARVGLLADREDRRRVLGGARSRGLANERAGGVRRARSARPRSRRGGGHDGRAARGGERP